VLGYISGASLVSSGGNDGHLGKKKGVSGTARKRGVQNLRLSLIRERGSSRTRESKLGG